ncbi:EcoRII N-terminal effector-binding domain-containing protein [Gluconobacter cerinus]|uniref:EcoRII N-terminal effector-binding domain-containing protein n=1 Tax=Gluconobacter cerinus TaxID=38307 RepID=UPI001B8CB086|nr:EcoRII N-terminal effector-binding domain-containing protein [Gluconobacter cerinus]MBS1069751.1 hypothetical protein [Gluconobacter cerinus]
MSQAQYAKLLSANDTGETGGHQAGILVPKTDAELLAFFPPLDLEKKNPDAWIWCEDKYGKKWKLRYIYYNNKLHTPGGTRNEYRITWMTEYLRLNSAKPGDSVVFEATDEPDQFKIKLEKPLASSAEPPVIKLAGWRRVH